MIMVGRFFLILFLMIESANAWDLRGYAKNYIQSFSNQNINFFDGDYFSESISARASVLNDFSDKFSRTQR